jgi:hypothetical protein
MRMVVLAHGQVVAEPPVLDHAVRNIDPEPGDPAVEPEAEDAIEGHPDLLAPPVQVRRSGRKPWR